MAASMTAPLPTSIPQKLLSGFLDVLGKPLKQAAARQRKQVLSPQAQQRFPAAMHSCFHHLARRRGEALHLVEHNEVALEAPARADEVGKPQQKRQRNPPPLPAAQLPCNACTPSADSTQSMPQPSHRQPMDPTLCAAAHPVPRQARTEHDCSRPSDSWSHAWYCL